MLKNPLCVKHERFDCLIWVSAELRPKWRSFLKRATSLKQNFQISDANPRNPSKTKQTDRNTPQRWQQSLSISVLSCVRLKVETTTASDSLGWFDSLLVQIWDSAASQLGGQQRDDSTIQTLRSATVVSKWRIFVQLLVIIHVLQYSLLGHVGAETQMERGEPLVPLHPGNSQVSVHCVF